jgi:NAD/NADP transhydrogenase beta subunit
MNEGITTVAYIGASILFIMSLGGLSNQETARRGNIYGIIGMVIAVLATILATHIDDYTVLLGAVVIGGAIGLFVASNRRRITSASRRPFTRWKSSLACSSAQSRLRGRS